MPGIGGFFKGVRAAFASTAKGAPKGTYTKLGKDGAPLATKAKPGYKLSGGQVTKEEGALAAIKRNPKISLAAAGAGLAGGAYFLGGSGSSGAAGAEGASEHGGGYSAQA